MASVASGPCTCFTIEGVILSNVNTCCAKCRTIGVEFSDRLLVNQKFFRLLMFLNVLLLGKRRETYGM